MKIMKHLSQRAALASILLSLALPTVTEAVDFTRDIQPILAGKCLTCHGPDEAKREADLRLDERDSALEIDAIVPGKPDESELLRRILSDDPDEVMPPPDQKNPVTEEEIELLRAWITDGAEFQAHWAFTPPVRTPVAEGEPFIDTFVGQRLKAEGLQPSPEADREMLLRRLSLDLTGLPPTIEEIDAFLNDTSADAYEKQVERLLASPHYGERWARWWLDAARYADSDGFEKDLPRQQWAWRDWVIESMNRDLPYDQFIVEQIAGDLLPDATQDQRVATGFLRNSMVNEEGAILAEEFRMEGLIDRMDCVGKAVLGLTLSCGQCHDHKYDPITQREYYQVFAYLNNAYEAVQRVYDDEDGTKMDEVNKKIREQEDEIRKAIADWEPKLTAWADEQAALLKKESWTGLHPSSAEVPDGICHPDLLSDGTVLNLGFRPNSTRLTVLVDTKETDMTGLRLDALTHGDLIFGGPGRNRQGSFAISAIVIEAAPLSDPEKFTNVKLDKATANAKQEEGLLDPFFRHTDKDRRIVGGAHFLIDNDLKTAWSPDRGPRWHNEASHAVLKFEKPVGHEEGTRYRISMGFRHGGRDGHGRTNNFIGRFRLSVTADEEPKASVFPANVIQALLTSAEQRTEDQQRTLLRQWATGQDDTKKFVKNIDQQWAAWPEGDSVLNLAPRVAEHKRKTHILSRGSWLNPTDEVQPGVPASMHSLPEGAEANRLAFARWLVDPKAPTTARVIVNRVWQAYFGTGLVSTSEDFGIRSEPPSHPRLLDTLAVELMQPTMKTSAAEAASPWSFKHLHRVIALSDTYRQTSRISPELLERDPKNILLARGPRFRGNAEMVRDIALTASGLLTRDIGGPSIFPPVPKGLFALSFVHVDFWKTATGPDRYCRSLYVFRRRSIPDPVLANFDAPTGDISCVRRLRSNTPLAALTNLNATIFTEAAQALSLRILEDGGSTDSDRLTFGFRACTGRRPTANEITMLSELLEGTRERLSAGELKAADIAFNEFTKPGDLPSNATPNQAAAWTIVARVLLNLDATITKG